MVPVNAETVRAVYTMFQAFPPFSRWGLPAADRLNFVVEPLKSRWADFSPETMTLRVSSERVSTIQSLMIAVGHEMCHVKQLVSGRWPAKDAHNAHFHQLAKQVCKAFDFDEKNF